MSDPDRNNGRAGFQQRSATNDFAPNVTRATYRGETERFRADDEEGLLPETLEIPSDEIDKAIGEPFAQTLDINTWDAGGDLAGLYGRLEREVAEAVREEGELRQVIRNEVLPKIGLGADAPVGAGVYVATLEDMRRVHTHALFNGAVEACDGTVMVHDTLPLTVVQIGVGLVSYAGEQGAWTHRVYRRDLRSRGRDPVRQALELLERRERRGGLDQEHKAGREAQISELLGRGLMSYSERAVLARKATAPWRMGHGNPAPYELLTGSGNMDLLREGLNAVRSLVLEHKQFVYVPSAAAERLLLTIGYALKPFEFAIVRNDYERMFRIVDKGNLRGKHRDLAFDFINDVGPNVAVGVYRTFASVPPQIFYAHVEHALDAAQIAMADSMLQPHRGFPTLIDVVDTVCRSTFGADIFNSAVQSAYAVSGDPLTYLPERATRA